MTAELAVRDNVTELARPVAGGLALTFQDMVQRVAMVDQFYREVMQDGTDYGVIPGTGKPSLYQPGAQMLDQIFGYVPTFEVMPASVIAWDRPIPFFHYVIRCRLLSGRTGEAVAEGIGSCNSYEDKYRWRNAKRTCPDCKAETIIKGKEEFGGGWICFKRQGGCGTKFRDGEAIIEDQRVGRIENDDTASLENTISKMAQKRAHVAATLNATGASRIFTQDIEDLPQFQNALVVESRSAPAPVTRAADEPQGERPATDDERAKFDAGWKKGTARAVACGVAPDDAPPPNSPNSVLNRAGKALFEAIQARERLNTVLVERVNLANQHGGDLKTVEDPSTLTDQEVHEMIATADRMLEAAEQHDDEDDAAF